MPNGYPFILVERDKGKHCQAYRCKKHKDPGARFCSKHYKRLRKHRDPVGYAYSVTRCNAKRRGKTFELTLAEWRQFCEETDYIKLKGRKAASASIDRKVNSLGYTLSNIQVMSLSDNGRKADKDLPF